MNTLKKINKKDIEDIIALTPTQEGMLYHYLKDPDSDYYFEQLSLTITGEIDFNCFKKAWDFVIETNEMLRTGFKWDMVKKPMQIILEKYQVQAVFHDFSSRDINENDKLKLIEEIKDKDRKNRFDLNSVPFRVMLCKIDEYKYEMIVSNHHILYDGWSNGIILKEFFASYIDLVQQKSPVRPVKQRYKEYTKQLHGQDRDKPEKYWTDYLKGFGDNPELSIKRKTRKNINAAASGNSHCSAKFSKKVQEKLEIFTGSRKITLACLLYSAWGVLLQRYNNCEDVIFGTTVSGRPTGIEGIENIVGLFINTVPLRVRTNSSGHEKVRDFLYRMNKEMREREKYESASLVEIKEWGKKIFEGELFDMIVVIENYPLDQALSGRNNPMSLSVDSYSIVETTHYDLTVGVTLMDDIDIEFTYNKDLFEEPIIKELACHFVKIVEDMVNNPVKELPALEILSKAEKEKILFEFNNTAVDYARDTDTTIHQLFARQAERIPDHVALIGQVLNAFGVGHLSYGELNEQSGQLAGLLKEKGVGPDAVAAIMVKRSLEMIVGIFGILKAGGAYLPIDPDYPEERIDYMLKDSGAKILLKDRDFTPDSFGIWNLEFGISPPGGQLAYIIYTSGTTGKPKGVMIEHAAVMNRLSWVRDKYRLNERDVILQATSFVFDVSVCEMFRWIPAGGKLCLLPPGGEKDPEQIIRTTARNGVTTADFIPSMLTLLLDYAHRQNLLKELATLRWVWTGVEVVDMSLVKKFNETLHHLNQTRLINAYGPTESTVDVTYFDCSHIGNYDAVPIGKPMANVRIYILARNGAVQPVGVYGQLCIAGKGLARGYLNNPDLTAEKFCLRRPGGRFLKKAPGRGDLLSPWTRETSAKNFSLFSPYSPHSPIYKTGDLARWLPDGNIEFLGRIDHQVKIRGHRVELGEIESHLLKHGKIKDAAVIVKDRDEKEKLLCAYIVSREKIDIPGLEEKLSLELPDYMVPAYIKQLDKIPLTPGGKVDRRALPGPDPGIIGVEYTAPVNPREEKLVSIWSEILNLEKNEIGTGYNFFKLGGHSLKAVRLISRIQKELNVEIPLEEIFKLPTIRELAGYIRGMTEEKYVAIEAAEEKEYYELASAQKRLYFLQKIDENAAAYNMPSVWLMEGALDKNRLQDTLEKLVQRHESLRTSFKTIDQKPVQVVHKETVIDLWSLVIGEDEKSEIEDIIKNFIKPFDLSRAPLLRVGLIKEKRGKHILMVDMHHIISDGISVEILIREFTAFWACQKLPPLNLRYKDYSEWQRNKKQNQKEKIKRREAYWLKQFEGEIPGLDLPVDYTRPSMQDFAGRTMQFEIDKEKVDALKSLAHDQEVTLFMLLFCFYNIFLGKLSGQEDIVVGTPIAGRRHTGLEAIIGMFVNTLALRNFPVTAKTFNRFLKEIKENTIKAFENRDYPYENLVEQVEVERDTGRNPLFDCMFVLQNPDVLELEIPGLKVQPVDFETYISKFDLTLTAVEAGKNLLFTFEYSTILFKEETIRRFIGYFNKIIAAVIENRDIRISGIEIINEKEKNQVLYTFNDTGVEYPRDKTIPQLFAEQVEQRPHRAALAAQSAKCKGQSIEPDRQRHAPCAMPCTLTYRELNRESNRLARILKEKGAAAETIVGIMVERSSEMITGILAILKAGGAYLPIDPDYPEERISYMLKDSGAKVLITTSILAKEVKKLKSLEVKKKLDIIFTDSIDFSLHSSSHLLNFSTSHSTNLVYIIYTSGTTGRPKGVVVKHQGLVNMIYAHRKLFAENPDSRVSQVASPAFDAMALEIWPCLSNGAALYIADDELRSDPVRMQRWLIEKRITISFQPTVMAEQLLDKKWPDSGVALKSLRTGGDRLTRSPARPYPFTLYNLYGPTEDTVWTTWTEVKVEPNPKRFPPIGKPVDNHRIYIISPGRQLQPIGIPGQLCTAGDGLARGYLNQPELTAEKFDRAPFKQTINACSKKIFHRSHRSHKSYITYKSYFYKTGDLARWLSDGNIEFLGRMDHQVKIRGYRIELEEISSQLLKRNEIEEALVLARENESGEKFLCAYIASQKEFNLTGLRDYLSGTLPGYMIPSYFVNLDKIPLTPNGKIDRKALPEPVIKTGKDYIAAGNEIEKKLLDIWSEVLALDKEKISMSDNFFHLGGHSLKAAVLTTRLQEVFSTALTIRNMFQFPTITAQARLIRESTVSPAAEIGKLPGKPYYELSYSQKRLWLLNKMEPRTKAFNLPVKITLCEPVDESIIRKILVGLITRHESFRTFFKEIDKEPLQVIEPVSLAAGNRWKLDVIDCTHLEEKEREKRRRQLLMEESLHIFNLEKWPLFRARLIKYGTNEYDFVLNMHHIITDGWSVEILRQEFTRMYQAYKQGIPFDIDRDKEPLRIRYKDYAAWHNRLLEDEEKMAAAKDFWKNYLSGTLPVLNLPYDFSPGPGGPRSRTSAAYCFAINPKTTESLRSFAREHQGSLFMALLVSFKLLLAHITGQEEILLAVPAAARQHRELKNIVGMFVNTLVLRSRVNMNETFIELFRTLQNNTFDALEYQGFPLEFIFSELKMKYPEIHVFFNMVNVGVNREQPLNNLNGYHIEETQEAKFDIVCYLTEYENAIQVSCHYFKTLFRPETIEKIMRLFSRVLDNISADPGKKAKEYWISQKKKNIFAASKHRFSTKIEKTDNKLEIKKEVKEAQQNLSKVNIDFLDYVEKNPGCLKKSNFKILELNDDLFRLQPWPTFIGPKTKNRFREAGVRLFNLIKQIPGKVFNYDLQKMSDYYQTPVKMLEFQLAGVTRDHIENLVARGDFLVTSTGLKCLEYNVTPSLGGWQIPAWESLYLNTPILMKFLKEYAVKPKNENLLGLIMRHAIQACLEKLSPNESELNIALAIKGYREGVTERNWMQFTGGYLKHLYKEVLSQVNKSLTGEVLVGDLPDLRLVDSCIFYKGKKIHGVIETYNGWIGIELMEAFKAGGICLFNGPVTDLLSNKLNLAVLSDPGTNAVFTEEERKIIDAYVPWTRKTTPGPTSYKEETIHNLEHFMLSRQEDLVIKPALGYGGKGIRVGNKTPKLQWEKYVKTAFHEKTRVVQELVESSPGVYQAGDGYEYHDMAWGFFTFGSQYGGAWVRVMPRENNKGVINCHQGASVSVIFEVDQ